MGFNRHIILLVKLGLFTFFDGHFFFKSCRKQLFTVLWNLRVKSTQFLGHFKWYSNSNVIQANMVHFNTKLKPSARNSNDM